MPYQSNATATQETIAEMQCLLGVSDDSEDSTLDVDGSLEKPEADAASSLK